MHICGWPAARNETAKSGEILHLNLKSSATYKETNEPFWAAKASVLIDATGHACSPLTEMVNNYSFKCCLELYFKKKNVFPSHFQ